MKKLKAMDDWNKGPLNDSEISEQFNTWWYLQQRCLEVAQHNVTLALKKEASTGSGVVSDPNPLATDIEKNVKGGNQATTPHYFSNSPTPNGPVIPQNRVYDRGNMGENSSEDEEEIPPMPHTDANVPNEVAPLPGFRGGKSKGNAIPLLTSKV